MQNNRHHNSDEFDEAVQSINALVADDVNADPLTASAAARLQQAILAKTADTPQSLEINADSASHPLLLTRLRLTFANITSQLTRPLPALVTAVFIITVSVLGVSMTSHSPEQPAVATVSEADLTFEELWLNEDQLLFSEGS